MFYCIVLKILFNAIKSIFRINFVSGYLRDPSGTIITIKNLRLSFCDAYWRPPQPPVARTYFNESVSFHSSERMIPVNAGKIDLKNTPLLKFYKMTLKHYVAVVYINI